MSEMVDPEASSATFEYGKDGPRLLVAGLDGSRTSWRACAYAAGLARRGHAKLVIVHVAGTGQGLAGLTPQAAALDAESERDWTAELKQELFDRVAEAGLGLDVTFEVRAGDPAHAIATSADEHQADAVIVGSSEARGHRLVGSTAVRLVRAGRWPVTVVP